MEHKRLYFFLLSLTVALLVLPALQQHAKLFKFKPLKGVTVATERPSFGVVGFMSGEYQTQEEQYLSEHLGFREPLIRCYNQLMWSLFHWTNCNDVVVGKGNWLYGNHAVADHFRQLSCQYADDDASLVAYFERSVGRLKKVQTILDKRGTKLFVMICPSKDIIYPEHLPDGHGFVMGDGLRAIEYFPQAFAENGINYLDMNAWFQQMKDTVSYPLYPMTGTHWSNVASMHVSDTLIRYLEWLTGKNMLNISVGPAYPSEAVKPDNDLENIMNLVWSIKPNQNYYAQVKVVPDSTAKPLNLITIGDSYFWNIAYTLPMDELFESYPYWYYYNTVYYDPNHDNVKQLNMVEELDRADVVMIILTTYHLYSIFDSFLNRVITCFSEPDPETLNRIVEGIMRKMETDSIWYQSLVEKAERKGMSLDEVMRSDALYVFRSDPEKFLSQEP